jgi:hypothetical protein
MATTFAHASPSPAFGAAPPDHFQRTRPSRHQWVDALVTLAVMACFTAAIAGMVGELHAVASTSATQAAATREASAALPQGSTSLGNSAHPGMRLI